MTRLAVLAAGAVLFATPGFAAEQTLTGRISDSMCRAHHELGGEQGNPDNEHDCTLACVKSGSKYVLVVGDKVFNIANQGEPALAENAGYTVKVTGDVQGNTVTASKVELVSKEQTGEK